LVRRALREVVGLYWESGVGDDVPALAWFLLSSLAPLALGLTALATVALGDHAQAQALADRVAGVLPDDVHDQLVELVLRTRNDSPLLIAAAILGMVWTSSGVVGVVDRCLARLLARERGGPLIGKLRNLGIAAVVAVLIVLLVLVATAGTGLVERIGVDATLVRVVVPLLTMVVITAICATLYRTLAAGAAGWRAAVAGGAVSGLLLEVTPTLAGYYLRLVAGRTPVELFLMLAGVLFTCYLVALGLLLGTGVTARVQLDRPLGPPR
jgi:membrane protein